jgi:hypothetical protein
MGEKTIVIDKHLIVNVFKISKKGWKKYKQTNKQIVKAMLQCITLPWEHVSIWNNGVSIR